LSSKAETMILVVLVFSGIVAAQTAKFEVYGFGYDSNFQARAINEDGTVAGFVIDGDNFRLASWDSKNGIQILNSNMSMMGLGINTAGHIVGSACFSDGKDHAFVYKNGTIENIGFQTEYASSAYGINNSGKIIGATQFAEYSYNKSLYSENGSTVDLGEFSFGEFDYFETNLTGINDGGVVSGYSYYCGRARAFTWTQDGGFSGLNSIDAYSQSSALAINDLGQVAGFVCNRDESGRTEATRAVIWNQDGTILDIGVPDNCYQFGNIEINNLGQVVGNYATLDYESRGFYWDQQTGLVDLSELVPIGNWWTGVYGINDHGEIIGQGFIDGGLQSFIMTPTPEPATLLLLGLGAVIFQQKCRK
jgi:probable HAF family extracellular repeat protein